MFYVLQLSSNFWLSAWSDKANNDIDTYNDKLFNYGIYFLLGFSACNFFDDCFINNNSNYFLGVERYIYFMFRFTFCYNVNESC